MAITKSLFLNKKFIKTQEHERTPTKLYSNSFQKSSALKLLRGLIESNENTNVTIKIGEWTHDCHLLVLQCYSELFKRYSFKNDTILELPEEQVSSKTFLAIYKWMLEDTPVIQRANVIELLVSACYLEIQQLITQIWSCLNGDQILPGDAAYFLYLEANILNVKCVKDLMLNAVSKFLLIMVAFKEFLLMPVGDLCTLLRSDTIGVNTEIETFMVALHWLSFDWSKRKKHIYSVMKNVRFNLIPPGFLIELDRNMIDNALTKRVMSRQKVRDLVSEGLKNATTRLCYGKSIAQNCNTKERHWIYDEKCEYHLKANQLIDYRIDNSKFFAYLKCLQKCEQNYWQTFANIKTEIPVSTSFFEGQNLQISERVKDIAQSCTINEISETDFSQQNLSVIMPNVIIEEAISSCPVSTINVEGLIEKNLEKYNQQSTKQFESDVQKISCQQLRKRGNLTHRVEKKCSGTSRSENCALLYKGQDSDCSFTSFKSIESQINIIEHQTGRENVQSQLINVPQPESIDQNEDNCSDTSSFISVISLEEVSKSYRKENRSVIMSVRSTSKKSVSYESTKKTLNKQRTKLQPTISTKHHKFEFKGVQFEQVLNNLSINSRKTSARDKQVGSGNEESENLNQEKTQSIDYLLPNLIPEERVESLCESIFKNKTLLILGGTDPYRQHFQKSLELIDRILFYSNRFQKWAQLAHTAFGTRQHHAAVVCNGHVYIIGGTKVIPGCNKTFFETSIWALNIKTKTWSFETNLPKNRRDFAVIAVDEQFQEPGFFVIGGESFDRVPLDTVWFYNVARKIWSRKASLNTARYGFSAAIIKDEIWIAGGIIVSKSSTSKEKINDQSSSNQTEFIADSIETFKLNTALNNNKGVWTVSKYRLRQRCLFAKLLSTMDDKIFLIGGIGCEASMHSFDGIDCFDYDKEEWVQCGKLKFARHGHDAVLIGDYIAIIGGVSSEGKCALESIEFFCIKTSQIFQPIPALPRPLSGLAAVVINGEW